MKNKNRRKNYKNNSFFKSASNKNKIKIIPAPSPNYTNTTITPEFIVLHCIGYKDPLKVMNENKVSCHYLIPLQDLASGLIVYEVVKPPLRAWHAGVSAWKNFRNLNDNAIGIEIHMPDYAHAIDNKTLDFLYFKPFESAQIDALKILIEQIQSKYNIPNQNIIGHSDIAPWRNNSGKIEQGKTDPGPTLPWKQLADEGIGVWPNLACSNEDGEDLSAERAQKLLTDVGYVLPSSGEFDEPTRLTLGAARLRWTPSCFNASSGLAHGCYEKPFDRELACSLRNLAPQNYAPNTSISLPIILISVATPLLLLVLALVLYKYCKHKQNKDNEYEEIPETSNSPFKRY